MLGQRGSSASWETAGIAPPNAKAKVPVAVTDLSGVTALAAGGHHSCALLVDGTMKCWGDNSSGQLGNGRSARTTQPVPVSNVTGTSAVTAIASGAAHSCELLANGTVACWGDNAQGALGNGALDDSSVPVPVTGLSRAIAVVSGRHFSCALILGGTVQCWGFNVFGELGNGQVGVTSTVPVPVSDLTDVIALGSGDHHTCAASVSGTVKCWGWNLHGQLGNNSNTDAATPVAVDDLGGVTALTAEDFDSCALLADGTVRCWGYGFFGELGNGMASDSWRPVAVPDLSGVTAIAMKTDAAPRVARCWPTGPSGVGDSTASARSVPVWISRASSQSLSGVTTRARSRPTEPSCAGG